MHLPRARGALSAAVIADLAGEPTESLADIQVASTDVLTDGDLQLALWTLYELHYRGFDEVPDDREWDPTLIALRGRLESRFEQALREPTAEFVARALATGDDVPDQIVAVIDEIGGPPVASYLQRKATRDQVLDFMAQRSLYHLKESDPSSFVLARIGGRAKTALAELLHDEFGAGQPERLHADLFADALTGCGLDPGYGAYVDATPATSLAVNNVMSLFGLHRRLRGAALGHLAAFETTSAVPCRRIAGGIERVGLPAVVADYFHEHVEADSVHEQVALRDICGSLVEDEPALRQDVLFGAAACAYLDDIAGRELLDDWENGARWRAEAAS
jgi:pyrroloquinoline quinone (PQQ) biosynthesis protein C